MKPELCQAGERLHAKFQYPNFSEIAYYQYRRHIIGCKECQEHLGLNAMEIDVITDDIKLYERYGAV